MKHKEHEALAIHPASVQAANRILTATEDPDILAVENFAEADADRGIGIIHIDGIIGHKLTATQRAMGGVDTDDLIDQLEQAASEPGIATIILNIDSPGGTIGGVPEVAETVEQIQQSGTTEIIAYTDSMMASAAYWIATAANAIYASPSAEVGSIGVYLPVVDTSQALGQAGINVELIKAGKFKGAGYPGVAIDEEVRAFLQQEVNESYDEFAGFVQKYRPQLGQDKMQGQTFTGKRAASIGLIDGNHKNLKSLLQTF